MHIIAIRAHLNDPIVVLPASFPFLLLLILRLSVVFSDSVSGIWCAPIFTFVLTTAVARPRSGRASATYSLSHVYIFQDKGLPCVEG